MTATKTPGRTRHDRKAARAATAAEPTNLAATEDAENLFRPTRHDAIRPDPANPRKIFDEDDLVDLAESISRDGLLEPLVLRAIDEEPGQFMLIAGERRWRAIGLAIKNGFWPAERAVPAMLRQV